MPLWRYFRDAGSSIGPSDRLYEEFIPQIASLLLCKEQFPPEKVYRFLKRAGIWSRLDDFSNLDPVLGHRIWDIENEPRFVRSALCDGIAALNFLNGSNDSSKIKWYRLLQYFPESLAPKAQDLDWSWIEKCSFSQLIDTFDQNPTAKSLVCKYGSSTFLRSLIENGVLSEEDFPDSN